MLAGIGHGITSLSKVKGFEEVEAKGSQAIEQDWEHSKTLRKREEQRVYDELLWSNQTGLRKKKYRDRIKEWSDRFDWEVHGSFLSQGTAGMEWVRSGHAPFLPNTNKLAAANYMLRAQEIGWMLLRTLPLLQTSQER